LSQDDTGTAVDRAKSSVVSVPGWRCCYLDPAGGSTQCARCRTVKVVTAEPRPSQDCCDFHAPLGWGL